MISRATTIGTRTLLLLCGVGIGMALPTLSAYAQLGDAPREEVPAYSGRPPDEHPILAPCSRFDEQYRFLFFESTPVEAWPDMYHERVDKVIEEYLEKAELECDAENYGELLRAGPELYDLAASLPTWQDSAVPLTRFDTARVLLEYLRVYECALMEFDEFLYFDTTIEMGREDPSLGMFDIFMSDLMVEGQERAGLIAKERATARKILQRVLKLIGAFERLRPIEAELECMQRLSLDIRNVSALTAEASACLPRTWNAKDSLRDFPEEDE